jgi:flagellar basal body-associated protein FliL
MNFHKNRLIHWIAALAIAMSALAPSISQAVSLAKHGQGFAMEICSVDGSKLQINVQSEDQEVAEQAQPCPYCLAQSAITPAFNTNLTFQAPQTFALLPQLFYQSPKPLAVWVTPPSAAPPTQA